MCHKVKREISMNGIPQSRVKLYKVPELLFRKLRVSGIKQRFELCSLVMVIKTKSV